jgi:hypothetical protein
MSTPYFTYLSNRLDAKATDITSSASDLVMYRLTAEAVIGLFMSGPLLVA